MQVGHVFGSHLAVSMAKDGAAWEFGKVCMELKLQCLGAPINCALQIGVFFGGFFKQFGGGNETMHGPWHFPSSLEGCAFSYSTVTCTPLNGVLVDLFLTHDLHVGGSESQQISSQTAGVN